MPEDLRSKDLIAAILTDSGLPMERRAEVAEELRGHLEQAIASKREAGLNQTQAVEAALADFGPPRAIRKQLRRQQRMLDRRHAWTKLRGQFRWIVVGSAVFGAVLAILSPERVPLLNRCLGGVYVFVWSCFFVGLSVGLSTTLESRLNRRRPRDEYRFLKSLPRWMAVGAVALSSVVAASLVTIAAGTPLLHKNPASAQFLLSFWYNFGVAWLESAGRNFGLAGIAVLGLALTAALYERSRCIDEPAIPTSG